MKYEEFAAKAKSAFDDCSEMKRMLWNMQTVVAAVPDMVRKNERLGLDMCLQIMRCAGADRRNEGSRN